MIKLISWNVNGLRAIVRKGLHDFVDVHQPDIFCLQEIKATEEHITPLDLPFAHRIIHAAQRKGYSGVATLSHRAPLSTRTDFALDQAISEGRVLVTEWPWFFLVNVYTPNSQAELTRLGYRHQTWDPAFCDYLKSLEATKPLVICGDLNVAHQPIDLERPEANTQSAGYTPEERQGFERLLAAGFIDTFRHFYPQKTKQYTWWSYRAAARERNVGWRIDYFLISPSLLPQLHSAFILPEALGSDHAPVGITLAI
jgi:exodeoxyribonuclease-3